MSILYTYLLSAERVSFFTNKTYNIRYLDKINYCTAIVTYDMILTGQKNAILAR